MRHLVYKKILIISIWYDKNLLKSFYVTARVGGEKDICSTSVREREEKTSKCFVLGGDTSKYI